MLVKGRWQKPFLIATALILVPIALTYGLIPEHSLALLYGIETGATGPVLTHILRALMGLYLGMAGFWLVGAFRARLRHAALCSLVVFMGGVAGGRLISFVCDGVPHWLFLFFFLSELLLAVVGLLLIRAGNIKDCAV